MKKIIPLIIIMLCFAATAQSHLGITHGTLPADNKAAPTVAIYNSVTEHFGWPIDATCGGVLVAPEWVLTAAHCVATLNSHGQPVSSPWTDVSNLSIGIGAKAGMKANADHVVAITSIHATQDTIDEITKLVEGKLTADEVLTNDYVLLKLATPITDVAPATLPDGTITPGTLAGLTAYTVGYQTYTADQKGYLLEGEQSYLSPNDFALLLWSIMALQDPQQDPSATVQAYLDNQDKFVGYMPTTACQHPDEGDSGDALYADINGKWTVIGLTDLGVVLSPNSPANPTTPCQYSAAFYYLSTINPVYLNFIKTTIQS